MSFIVSPPFDHVSYETFQSEYPDGFTEAFTQLALPVVHRVFAQCGRTPPGADYLTQFLKRIATLAEGHGLARPLPDREIGAPGEPDDVTMRRLLERLQAELPAHSEQDLLLTIAYQFFLTLILPEFKACRQSYLEEGVDGCLRQDLVFCADRISGSHCEDCPYFTALSEAKHRKLLSRQWKGDAGAFEAESDRFLPPDFRLLRVYLHLHRRHS